MTPFPYSEAKSAIFATGTIPDGYAGSTADVGFALHPDGYIVTVHATGYFRAGLPHTSDEREAFRFLHNLPETRVARLARKEACL